MAATATRSWLIHSTGGFLLWLGAGTAVLAILAWWEWRSKGKTGRRWREYSLLAGMAMLGSIYAAALDQITLSISWEYFYFGKGIGEGLAVGQSLALRGRVVWMGLQAGLGPGLLIGAALLIANNPRGSRPQLSGARLALWLAAPLTASAALAAIGVVVGGTGHLTWCLTHFQEMVTNDTMRPFHFMATWAARLGAYLGGLLGAIAAVWGVLRQRQRLYRISASE